VLPDPRSLARAPRTSRALALGFATAVGVAGVALVAGVVDAPKHLPPLFGGSLALATYYGAYYPSALSEEAGRWSWDGTVVAGFLFFYTTPRDASTAATATSAVAFFATLFALLTMAERDVHETRARRAPEPPGVGGRLGSLLRSSEVAALCLSFVTSVAGFLVAGWLLDVSGFAAWLLLIGLAPSVYYRVHYGPRSVESPVERRVLRVAVAVLPATWLGVVDGSVMAFAVPALLGVLLVDAVTVGERVPALTDADDEDEAGSTVPWRRTA